MNCGEQERMECVLDKGDTRYATVMTKRDVPHREDKERERVREREWRRGTPAENDPT